MQYDKLSETLKRILFHKNMRSSDLARATGIPKPTAQRIVAGNCVNPHLSSLIPIADYFDITLEQLRGLAPIDWLSGIEQLKEFGVNQVPLLGWQDIKAGVSEEIIQLHAKAKKILTESLVSTEAFALTLKDSSMEPIFPANSLVIFDPQRGYKDRYYVLVKLAQYDEPLFRQLIIDAADLFVKPLHPDLEHFRMQLLGKDDIIMGVLVEARQHFTN